MMSELLELWTIVVCSAMLNIVAFDAVAAAAGTTLFFSIFFGRTTVVIELDDVPLVLGDGGAEFGAEYPIGQNPFRNR